jgi:hypothetical protein
VYYAAIQNDSVIGFLSKATQAVPSTSYGFVWWARTEDDTFTMKGIDAASINEAVCVVREEFSPDMLFYQQELDVAVEACVACGATSAAAGSTTMENGLSVDDPLQTVASALGPELMELAVACGAAGASGLSALAVTPSASGTPNTSAADDLLKWMTQTTEGLLAGEWSDPDIPSGPEVLATACSTTVVYGSWTAATPCAGGGCRYTGTAYTITCCRVGTATICTTTTAAHNRTCPGACVTTPVIRPPCR